MATTSIPPWVSEGEMRMCRPVTCRTCGGTTWAGCGMHVDDVMRGVPTQQRCTCEQQERQQPARRFGVLRRKG